MLLPLIAALGGCLWLLILVLGDTESLVIVFVFTIAVVGYTGWYIYRMFRRGFVLVSPKGLTIRSLRGTKRIPWGDVESIDLAPYPEMRGMRQSALDHLTSRQANVYFAQLTLRKRPSLILILLGHDPVTNRIGLFTRIAMVDVCDTEAFVELAQRYLDTRD